jgi:hypothetical protein
MGDAAIRAVAGELRAAIEELAASLPSPDLQAFDSAVAEEMALVSHFRREAIEPCKRFAGNLRTRLAAPQGVQAEPKTQWGDARVQTVYEILCSQEVPPGDQHWEGWVARRIVDALATPPSPPAVQPDPAVSPDVRELVEALDRLRRYHAPCGHRVVALAELLAKADVALSKYGSKQ